MKTNSRTIPYKTKNQNRPANRAIPSKSILSKIGYSTKKYSKIALKSMLLSKAFSTTLKLAVIGMVFSTALYGAYALIGTTISKDVIVSKSEIISRVAKLTTLPQGAPDAVVRVQDPETLKKQNSFYDSVKQGDYIIVYPQLAIIYDLRNNVIIGLKRSR